MKEEYDEENVIIRLSVKGLLNDEEWFKLKIKTLIDDMNFSS